ncbi:hypothetical protein [Pseudonocardia sp. NPDC049635]|uniref:hypothetical protein n=1 Tax=Pseudonocardia sp. NPDC049635 TaxID=3155506 RepID=UPI0033FB5CA0
MSNQDTELGATQRALDRLDHALIYRWPHIAGPAVLAVLSLAVTWGTYEASHRWPLVGWLPWALTGLSLVVLVLGMDSVSRLPGPRERRWAGLLWVGGTAWTTAAGWLSPFTGPTWLGLGPLLWAWLALLVIGWPPYFKHRRVRRAVEVSHEIAAWSGDAVGLPRVDLVSQGGGADSHSWWARLQPRVKGEYTLAKLRQAVPRIAARYDVAQGDVSIEPVRDGREGEYLLRVQTSPREERGAAWDVPEKAPDARDPFPIGVQPSGAPIYGELARREHGGVDGLAAGQKGYGKTEYAKRTALHALACRNALPLICDLKPGSPDYGDGIGPAAYVYATAPAQVDLVVRALLVICEQRGKVKRPDRKVLVFQLDETALYFTPTVPEPAPKDMTDPDQRRRWAQQAKRAAEQTDADRVGNMERLAAISRAFDVALRMQVQRGKAATLGGPAVRSALLAGEIVGFHSPREADGALLSDDGEFQLSKLPRGVPGECLVQNGAHPAVTRGRLHRVTREQERAVLERFGSEQGDLHDDELRALDRALGQDWHDLRAANRVRAVPPMVEPEPEPEPVARVVAARMTPEQSRQHVFDALVSVGRPASLAEVVAAAGKGDTLVRGRLAELVAEGRVERTGRNVRTRYAPTGSTPGTPQ